MANVSGTTRYRSDTARELIYKKSAHQFHHKLQEKFEHRPRTMALIPQIAKAGKALERPTLSRFRSAFPALAGLR
jgi:hypothetical protein